VAEPFDILQFGPNMYFIGGELDMATSPKLEEAVRASVEAGGPLFLDLSAVSFMDSTGIRAIISIARALDGRGCLVLHAPQARVRRVLDIVRIGDIDHLHLEECSLIAYPELYLDWTPPADLRNRFAALRAHADEA
jgi:anti-sigma B factor antagonist